MPQIAAQETVLNGRGRVLLYANGNGAGNWYYKEKVKGLKKYREKKIEGAKNLQEAIELAPQVAIELAQDAVKKPSITTSIDPLDLIAREEKLQRAKEKLFQAKKKEENPKINLDKAIKEWLLTQEKRVEGGDLAQSSYENKFNCINWVKKYFKNKKRKIS